MKANLDPWSKMDVVKKFKIHVMANIATQRFDENDYSIAAEKSRQMLEQKQLEALKRAIEKDAIAKKEKAKLARSRLARSHSSSRGSVNGEGSPEGAAPPPLPRNGEEKGPNVLPEPPRCSERLQIKESAIREEMQSDGRMVPALRDGRPTLRDSLEDEERKVSEHRSPGLTVSELEPGVGSPRQKGKGVFGQEHTESDPVVASKLVDQLAAICASSCQQLVRIVPVALAVAIFVPDVFDKTKVWKFNDTLRVCCSVEDAAVEPVTTVLSMPLEGKHCIVRDSRVEGRSTVYIPVASAELVGVVEIEVAEDGEGTESGQHLADRSTFDSLLRQYLLNLGSALYHSFIDTLPLHESPTVAKMFLLQSRVDRLTDELLNSGTSGGGTSPAAKSPTKGQSSAESPGVNDAPHREVEVASPEALYVYQRHVATQTQPSTEPALGDSHDGDVLQATQSRMSAGRLIKSAEKVSRLQAQLTQEIDTMQHLRSDFVKKEEELRKEKEQFVHQTLSFVERDVISPGTGRAKTSSSPNAPGRMKTIELSLSTPDVRIKRNGASLTGRARPRSAPSLSKRGAQKPVLRKKMWGSSSIASNMLNDRLFLQPHLVPDESQGAGSGWGEFTVFPAPTLKRKTKKKVLKVVKKGKGKLKKKKKKATAAGEKEKKGKKKSAGKK